MNCEKCKMDDKKGGEDAEMGEMGERQRDRGG